jgi:anti-sigma regulatory factor (Ser/Thr protein kinase)
MIDLSRTRRELLVEIEAPDVPGEPMSDITDPCVAATDAHVLLSGRGRDDLFPLLKLALSERFRTVPRLNLTLDLLMPLKNALGNAYKHGNATDPAKAVSVEIVLTRKGAFIAVTDQGPGFDVALTFRRFQEQQDYFMHFGIGFHNLHRAMSTVSYENGGRTVLLCYRPPEDTDSDPDHASSSWLPSACDSTDTPGESGRGDVLPKVLDAGWMQARLSAELAEFGNGQARLESCRVYEASGRAGDDCGNRYVLRVAVHDRGPAETRILTGRFHTSEAAARADFEAAADLREAMLSKGTRLAKHVWIPPVARLTREPRLVLYDFDSWLDLGEYLSCRGKLRSVRRCVGTFGRALARLHRSPCAFPDAEPGGADLQPMFARAEATLRTLPSGPELVDRLGISIQRVQETSTDKPQTLAAIHGALSWDCIRYGVDGEFYLFRFESCRRSDPRLDLGGFAADLLCFSLAAYDDAAYRIWSNAFVSKYNSKAEHPVREDDLQPYIVLALCERIQRAESRTKAGARLLLAALNAVLCERAIASEVSP